MIAILAIDPLVLRRGASGIHMVNTNSCVRSVRAVATLATGLLLGSSALAADSNPSLLNDPFYLSLGTFILNSDTEVRFDGDTGRGTAVDWERTFGGGDLTRFRLDGHWRFGDSGRHKARFMWFNASRSGSRSLDEEIEFGGEVYPVNVKVSSETSFDIYQLAYEYAFLKRDTYEIDGTIGVHLASLSLGLKAKASGSGGVLDADIKREGTLDAPLPVIGLRGIWQLPHNFSIDAGAQIFSLSIDQYDGNLQDYRVMVNWQPKKWLGFGLGYNRFDVDVDVDGDDNKFNGNLNWQYSGPMLSYSAVF
jgi:hypothetical protein